MPAIFAADSDGAHGVTPPGRCVRSFDTSLLGARVEDALVVIERLQGGRENLASEGLELHVLFTIEELEAAGG